eukprot:9331395-Pyramimonas_sp.AAC.1
MHGRGGSLARRLHLRPLDLDSEDAPATVREPTHQPRGKHTGETRGARLNEATNSRWMRGRGDGGASSERRGKSA